jgi:hypothetical protein
VLRRYEMTKLCPDVMDAVSKNFRIREPYSYIADGDSLAHSGPSRRLLLLIAVYTAPGDVILGPFAGSGTTATAAKQLQRRYIAIEMEPQHQATASHRLQAAVTV